MALITDVSREERTPKRRRTIGDPACFPKFSENGVKRLMLAAVFPEAGESYQLINEITTSLNIKLSERVRLCSDLKLVNIVLGIQSHQCRHPCPMCEWVSGEDIHEFPLRKFEKLASDYENFVTLGKEKEGDVKNFFNCLRPACSMFPQTGEVISVVSIPELHILIGIVNKLYKELKKVDKKIATAWTSDYLHLKADEWSSDFNGNASHKMLKNVEKLRNIIDEKLKDNESASRCSRKKNQSKRERMYRIALCLDSFRNLVHSSFGVVLRESWREDLTRF